MKSLEQIKFEIGKKLSVEGTNLEKLELDIIEKSKNVDQKERLKFIKEIIDVSYNKDMCILGRVYSELLKTDKEYNALFQPLKKLILAEINQYGRKQKFGEDIIEIVGFKSDKKISEQENDDNLDKKIREKEKILSVDAQRIMNTCNECVKEVIRERDSRYKKLKSKILKSFNTDNQIIQ